MVRESDLNFVLSVVYDVLEQKIPSLGNLSLGHLEATSQIGGYGSIVLSFVLLGDIECKVTLVLDWEPVLALAKELSTVAGGGEVLDAGGPKLLEPVVQEMLNALTAKAEASNLKVDGFYCLP